MKKQFIGLQYEQLAKEQFCKIIKKIPFVSDIIIINDKVQNASYDFCCAVYFEGEARPIEFYIIVKSNGERRFVNSFIDISKQYNSINFVFMAPYISEESANIMSEQKYSYMDLSGNCYIVANKIFMHILGQPNKFIATKEKKNYFCKSSSASSTIMRTMLNCPEKCWKIKTLAKESGKALGTVSNVKFFLRDRDWIKEYKDGFTLNNIKEMLYTWAKDYHKDKSVVYEYYSFETIPDLERKIAIWSNKHDSSAVLGGFSASVRYSPVVRYKKVETYVKSEYLDDFIQDMNLQRVSTGGNIIITIPHDENPLLFSRKIDGVPVTSPVQTVLDLLGNSGRGEEAANAIITKQYYGEMKDD